MNNTETENETHHSGGLLPDIASSRSEPLNSRKMDFLKNLNEAQLDAVVYHDGPELVVAGAGAGKTRVLTTKIAQLIQNGIFPSHILVLTFTNKAAREMNERIAKM